MLLLLPMTSRASFAGCPDVMANIQEGWDHDTLGRPTRAKRADGRGPASESGGIKCLGERC